jgi:tRNA nucleotidyltransferase (CCA-adding enzyme)
VETYLVGGAVRDSLLGIAADERDWVVVGATPERLLDLGYTRADPRFPVFIHPETGEEYALARRETKRGRGHKGFELEAGPEVTLEEDLARRDLRVNAMARDPHGRLVDPFGGRADIEARRLHHVTPAFVEDPLRVLRTARFAAMLSPLGFQLDRETLELMREMARSGELESLSTERIWRETAKALSCARPEVYLEVLSRCGALVRLMADVAPIDLPRALAVLTAAREARRSVEALAAAAACALSRPCAARAARRLGAPASIAEMAGLIARPGAMALAGHDDDAEALMQTIEELDGIRRPQRLARYVEALASLGASEPTLAPALERLLAARTAAASVDAATLRRSGLEGADLGRALRERRVRSIQDLIRRDGCGAEDQR